MDYLQIEKYRLAFFFVHFLKMFFFSLSPSQNVFCLFASANQNESTQTRISPHKADMAWTVKAVFSH